MVPRLFYKTFLMLNYEHEILNARGKYKKFKKNQRFSGSDKPSMLFCLLINVKMPTRARGYKTFFHAQRVS